MARRIHVHQLNVGEVPLDAIQAHHARDVLRLSAGTRVEVFDDAGATADGDLIYDDMGVFVRVARIEPSRTPHALQWTVAAAVPKGERADWMVEKLSELGAAAFIPLKAARSIVLPEGTGKRDRWTRIATESAKQSRRAGVMRIEPLTPLPLAIERIVGLRPKDSETGADRPEIRTSHSAWFLATEVPGLPISQAIAMAGAMSHVTLFIGPEGGWTQEELALMQSAGLVAVRLGATILRIETAAVAAGAVVSMLLT